MVITALNMLRGAFRMMWLVGISALIALVALPHVLGLLDRQMYVVRGASMTPEIPIGAVIVIREVDARIIQPGDVITFRAGSGTIVTHRVTQVSGGSQLAFSTKGDASQAPDPVVVPAEAVLGRVELHIPTLGLALTVLASTAGMMIVLGLFATLLLGGWFIDELVATVSPLALGRAAPERAA